MTGFVIILTFAFAGYNGAPVVSIGCADQACVSQLEALAAQDPAVARIQVYPSKGLGTSDVSGQVFSPIPAIRDWWKS